MEALARCTGAVVGQYNKRRAGGKTLGDCPQRRGKSASMIADRSSWPIGEKSVCADDAAGLDKDFEGPSYQFDSDFDLDYWKRALESGRELDESGYQSVLTRSQHSQYGTGWMMFDTASLCSDNSADEWDGYMTIGGDKVKIKEISDLLASRYAFLSGARTSTGLPILTFPDSRLQLSFPDYRRLITYLLQVPPLEDSYHGYVVVIDRRSDKWTTVKTLLVHIANYFPAALNLVYLLKPEGVLQRALEVGYKAILDSCQFRIVLCQSVQELHSSISIRALTLDLGGVLNYSHLEWVQHRMDIERMRASTQVIAQSLEEFSRCLRDTELPNDANTTEHILKTQRSEREAIKEDCHIAVRRGLSLLKNVRQIDLKPNADQLSPTRLHNVTCIERMLIQLDETEKSFEKFWTQHERRLQKCLELRRFEDDFRKLQSNFAGHMLHLEEHREVGDSVARVDALIQEHLAYMNSVKEDVNTADVLKRRGEELILVQEKELEGSLRPKCQELERMAEALKSALRRRLDVLNMSKQVHEQISVANAWCTKGVELLTKQSIDLFNKDESRAAMVDIDDFLASGSQLPCTENCVSSTTSAGIASPDLKTLVLMTTTDTRTLLQQVYARIADIKKMCESRRYQLEQFNVKAAPVGRHESNSSLKAKPIGAVSPDGHKIIDFDSSPRASTSSEENSNLEYQKEDFTDSKLAYSGSTKTHRMAATSNSFDSFSSQPSTPQRHYHYHRTQNGPPRQLSATHRRSQQAAIDRKLSLPTLSDFSKITSSANERSQPSSPSTTKAAYVINELVSTEETYVNEMQSVIEYYLKAFDSPALQHLVPASLRNRQNVIFGNLYDVWHFHSQLFLKDLLSARNSPPKVAGCFLERRAHFYLYNIYCQNKPRSEALRQEIGESNTFFQECQRNAGHRLPLGAYLLKPIQRITKYQLLLKELSKCCAESDYKSEIDQAVDCVLELLQQLNANMHQSHISGYPGDLSSLGQLLLQGKFSVWMNRKQTDKALRLRRTGKAQQRHLFLYTKAIIFCKHRVLQPAAFSQDFYEFKFALPFRGVSLAEQVKGNPLKFELSIDNRQETYIFLPVDQKARNEWITRVRQLILENSHMTADELLEFDGQTRLDRPISWTSQTSSDSSRSSRDLSSNPDLMDRISPAGDTNNNPPSPRSLPETEPLAEYVSGNEYSDSENNTIVTSDAVRLIA